MTSARILASSGSDSSYDLIVQAVAPKPEGGVEMEVLGMESTPLLRRFIEQATRHGQDLTGELPFGLRCIVAQRVPEVFVWKARMQAAVDKALDPSLAYAAPDSEP